MITNIKEAAIYRSGCYVKRAGSVGLKKGRQTIRIEGLTPTLDPSTVAVSLPGQVSGSNVNVERLSQEQQKEALKDLQRQLDKVREKIQTRNEQIEMLKTNTDFSAKENISVKEMSEFIDALPEKLEVIRDEIAKLSDEEETLAKQLKEKQDAAKSYCVRVDVEAPEDGTYPIELRYFEKNASWHPLYEIHTEEEDRLTVKLKAMIRQKTIEDWNGVALKLFTGNPTVSADIPELHPQYIEIHQHFSNRMMKAAGAGMRMESMAMDMAAPMMADEEFEMEDVEEELAQVNENDTMNEYELSGTYDLDRENEISADLTKNVIPCRYHVIAVPKCDSCGYLAASVKTSDIEDLIDTNAKVYHKGTYIGEICLDADLSEEEYDISLGRDEGIRLKRELKKKYNSNVLLKGQKKTEFSYLISAVSTKKKETEVTLIDQIPVSSDKNIVIDKEDLSKGKLDEAMGEIRWEFTLDPGEKKDFSLNYSVSYPKDQKINI